MLNLRLCGPIDPPFLRPAVLCTVLLLASCSGDDVAVNEHTFRVETGEDGVPTAVTSMVPKFDGLLMRYEEVVRLHQDEKRPESLLHQAYQYMRGPDGNYYMMDRGNSRVAVFGPDGEYLRSFGREGDGPGEFRSPMLQSVDERGVMIYDSRSRRVVHFDLDGALRDTYSNPRISGTVLQMNLEGELLVVMGYRSERRPDMSGSTWYIMTVMTTAGDTLGSVASGQTFQPAPVRIEGGSMIGLREHYSPYAMITHCPGYGILAEDGSSPEFVLYDFRCRPLKRFRLEMETRPVTEEDRETVRAYYRRRLEEEGEDERSRRLVEVELEHASFADTMPFYQSLSMDRFGYFWVYPPGDLMTSDPDAVQRIRLLSPEGEYLGDVELPRGLVGGSHPYLCTRTEDPVTWDYDYIVYRLVSAVPGFTYP